MVIETSRAAVERIAGIRAVPRAWLPVEIYPISAGIKGGLAGGAVMALLAGLYGILSGNGIWYAMNLLVGGIVSLAGDRNGQHRSGRSTSISSLSQFPFTC